MGKKRGKGAKQEADSDSDRLVDHLASILELSGAWGSQTSEGFVWDLLASSLEKLSMRLEILDITQRNGVGEVLQYDLLMNLEESAQEVRSQAETLSSEVKKVPRELTLCHELESICKQKEFARLQPLCRSLVGAIHNRNWLALEELQRIKQILSRLYNHDSDSQQNKDLKEQLTNSSAFIRRRCIDSKSPPWRDAIEFLQDLGSEPRRIFHPTVSSEPQILDDNESLRVPDLVQNLDPSNMILSASSISDAANVFAHLPTSKIQRNVAMLLVGAEGTGKTHCCNEIDRLLRPNVQVIRPSLPFDAMGLTVGAAENLVIAMVAAARTSSRRSILLLDNVENICGFDYGGLSKPATTSDAAGPRGGEPHIIARVRSVLLSLLETIQRENTSGNEMMLICTSRTNLAKSIDRFDTIFTLGAPNERERQRVISSHVDTCQRVETRDLASNPNVDILLSSMVECTSGLSYAELAQYCREAVMKSHESSQGSLGFLEALKRRLQSAVPESLKSGVNADFVDMKVFSARELRDLHSTATSERSIDLPLFGSSAAAAWEELRRLIVMPICSAKALNSLMFKHGGTGGKSFAGGVLLAGPPGSGKSSLAYYCAAVASAINPSVKLIDVSCTSLVHKEVGSSERSIHRLFQSVRAAAPCIVLMDGIENVAAVRGNDNTTEGTMDRVLSTLLTELDGVDSGHFSQENPACLAIIGITHNANWVDPALRRPGRLERVIELGNPEHEARKRIVLNELDGTSYAGEAGTFATLDGLAEYAAGETNGLTGAVVTAVCNEAKLISSKEWLKGDTAEDPQLSPQHMMASIITQRSGRL